MSVEGSRFARPVAPGAERARTIGWWALLLGIVALVHLVGGFVVAYLYLRSGQPTWPPSGVEPPSLVLPAVGVAAVFVAAVLASLEVRWTASEGPLGMLGALGSVLVGAVALWMQLRGLRELPVRWDEHVYGSLQWLLGGTNAVLVLAGIVVSVSLLAQHAMGHYDAQRTDELRIGALYWWFTAVASAALFITINVVPRM